MTLHSLKNNWYVIYTKPRHERKIAEKLSELKIENFLPLIKVLRNWHDRKKQVTLPLFPSYIFVQVTDIKGIHKILNIDGVLYFVRVGKDLAMVDNEIISKINLFMNAGVNFEISTKKFGPGQQVTIKDGLFAGYFCEIIDHCGANRVLLRLNVLQCNIIMNLDTADLLVSAPSA